MPYVAITIIAREMETVHMALWVKCVISSSGRVSVSALVSASNLAALCWIINMIPADKVSVDMKVGM